MNKYFVMCDPSHHERVHRTKPKVMCNTAQPHRLITQLHAISNEVASGAGRLPNNLIENALGVRMEQFVIDQSG